MIMARKLKVRLRVIIPAVENSISGTSFRPRDIYTSRKGISVEIGNTDAEGRLVLADALTLADEDKPALVVDFATLTGAARVALGPDVPAAFTDDDALAEEIARFRRVGERSALAHAAVEALRGDARFQGGRYQQRQHRRPGRRHHRGAVPAQVHRREILAASRHLRLVAGGQARAVRKAPNCRRRARSTRCSARATHKAMVALDPRINPFRPEIAAEYLKGQVEAARFVEGARHEVDRADRGLAPHALA